MTPSAATPRPKPPFASHFANAATAKEAIDMALLMIGPSLQDKEVSGCGFLHIVVMTPGVGPRDATFEEAILTEHSIGDRATWDADYAMYARAKTRLCWEHGMDGISIQATRPHLLKAGDTLLWGGICLDGIVVGVSGAFPWFDEAFAMSIACNLRALCKRDHAAMLGDGQAFIPRSTQ
jgi:hypothetical protein